MRPDVRTYAHDLNGVLSTILTTADLHAQKNGDTQAARAAFASVATNARRAGELAQKMFDAATATDAGTDSAYERDLSYVERIHPALDKVAAELERLGRGEDIPIVDRESGRFLSVIVSAVQARNVLEIGTAFGYSTLWMARALVPGGRITTIDPDAGRTALASTFFTQAGVADRISIVNRPALDVLPDLPKASFDLVFIDALKEEYAQYLAHSVPLLRMHGLVVADNVLWGHRASLPPDSADPDTTNAIRQFNEKLLSHPALNATIVPIGDGLGIAAKVR